MKVPGYLFAPSTLAMDRAGKDGGEGFEPCRLPLLWLYIPFADKATEV